MKVTKKQLKQIIKEELDSLLNEAYLNRDDVEAAIESGEIKPGQKFDVLIPYYDLKTKKTYKKKESAVYMGDRIGGQIPPGTRNKDIVYYKKSGGEISSMYYKSMRDVSKMDQKFRDDENQPYTMDDFERMK